MKFFLKIVLTLFVFFSAFATQAQVIVQQNTPNVGNSSDQQGSTVAPKSHKSLSCVVMDGEGKLLVDTYAYITYKSDGSYQSTAISRPSGNTTRMNIILPSTNNWHKNVGEWYLTGVDEKVFIKKFYAGTVDKGHLYLEERWVKGRLFSRHETVIDNNEHIVWTIEHRELVTFRVDCF